MMSESTCVSQQFYVVLIFQLLVLLFLLHQNILYLYEYDLSLIL